MLHTPRDDQQLSAIHDDFARPQCDGQRAVRDEEDLVLIFVRVPLGGADALRHPKQAAVGFADLLL